MDPHHRRLAPGRLPRHLVATTVDGLGWAALSGLLAGAVIGAAQWLALRPRVSALWIPATSDGMALGLALRALLGRRAPRREAVAA